jgi:hypothetical protein
MCIAHNQLVSVLGPTFVKNSDSFAINTDLAILAFITETGAHIKGVWGCYTPHNFEKCPKSRSMQTDNFVGSDRPV